MAEAPISAEEIAHRGFPSTFRGFDPVEVRAYLVRVSAELRAAAAREREMKQKLIEAERRAANPVIDQAMLTRSLGEETSRVLASAQEAARQLQAKAEDGVARILREAQEQAQRIRAEAEAVLADRTEEADAVAAEIRAGAQAEATALMEQARREAEAARSEVAEQARQLVQEAQAARARVLGDLARRRRIAHTQVEQLRAGRERLLDAYRVVRRTLDEVADELERVEAEARSAAGAAGRRVEAALEAGDAGMLGGEIDGLGDEGPAGGVGSLESVAAAPAVAPDPVPPPAVTPPEPAVPAPTHAPARAASSSAIPPMVAREERVEERKLSSLRILRRPKAEPVAGPELEALDVPSEVEGVRVIPASADPAPAAPAPAPAPARGDREQPSVVPGASWAPAPSVPGPAAIGGSGAPPVPQAPTAAQAPPLTPPPTASQGPPLPPAPTAANAPPVPPPPTASQAPPVAPAPTAANALPAPPAPTAVDQRAPSTPPTITDLSPSAGASGPQAASPAAAPVEDGGDPPAPAAKDPSAPASPAEAIFARIRADRAGGVSAAKEAQGTLAARPAAEQAPPPETVPGSAPGSPADPGPEATPVAPPHEEESLLQRRDEAIEAIESALARKLKRAMQDEHNDVLDRLRSCKGTPSIPAFLPSPADQAARYAAAAGDLLMEAARSGVRFVSAGEAEPSPPEVADVVEDLTEALVGPLRRGVERSLESGQEDASVLADTIGAAYRECKTQRLERLAADATIAAFSRGTVIAAGGAELRWVVDDGDAACPDCDDNALAGPTPSGQHYPTGQSHPPAHAGCRCLLVPRRP